LRTFVLSGGGNRGPLEVGAIKVLLEHGIAPEMIVGSSAGALNGGYLAIEPTLAQVQRMAQLWQDAGQRKLFTHSPARAITRALRGKEYLVDYKNIRKYLQGIIPPGVRTFGDLRVPLYVTICHLMTQTLYVYGDDPGGPLMEAMLTSAAVPGFFPPTKHRGELFVDGGVVSNLPVKVAMARGATEIWAIDLAFEVEPGTPLKSVFDIAGYSVRRPLYQNVLSELECAVRTPDVTLHHIPIGKFQYVPLGDFSRTEDMLKEGERAMREYLAHPRPNEVRYPYRFGQDELPPGPPGSSPFVEHANGVPVDGLPSDNVLGIRAATA
jgi:NTE family protein